MDSVKLVLRQLLQIVLMIGNLLVSAIITIEVWLRDVLTQFGVPEQAQSVLLVLVAVLLVIACLRLFGALIRFALVLILALIVLHYLAPMLPPA